MNTISIILIILFVALIIYIIRRKKDNDSYIDGLADGMIIGDAIDAIVSIGTSISEKWQGGGGSFSGGGASGDWDFDFDINLDD